MGIDVLYPADENNHDGNLNLTLDIISVHGLNGDKFRTWTEPKSKKLWLQDFLPLDLPKARIMTFGYDATAAFANSKAGIVEHARDLLVCLMETRERSEETKRSLIFVGHSLGGLVIKQALIIAEQEARYKQIYNSTNGVIFFGTPHQGSSLATFAATLIRIPTMLAIKPSPELLDSLSKGCERLIDLSTKFREHHEARPYEIISFYETRTLKGMNSLVVEKASALLTPPGEIPTFEEQIPVDANHREMCRFSSKKDKTYKTTVRSIQRIHKGTELPEVKNEHYLMPHTVNPYFTGRNDIREKLRESLIEGRFIEPKSQQRFVLYGLGGSGKTQMCLKFAQDYRERFWGVFWIDATSNETAEDSLLKIGRICQQEGSIDSVKQWLSGKDHWLLIIDNADDPNLDISRFFPEGTRGTVLITTRNPDLQKWGSAGSCRVDEMSSQDATTLLLKAVAIEELNDESLKKMAAQVVKTLGYFALAIIQAGAVIRQGLCSLDGFCELYSKQKKELLESGRSQSNIDYQFSVYTTWELSVRKIKETPGRHALLALELIRLFSFMHFEGISENIFEKAVNSPGYPMDWYETGTFKNSTLAQMMPTCWDGLLMGKALGLLAAFSLITISQSRQISMHPLVHEWSRDRMSETERSKAWNIAVVTLAMSVTDFQTFPDQQQRRSALPHIDACLSQEEGQLFAGDGPELAERSFGAAKFMLAYNENHRMEKALKLALDDLKSKETQVPSDHYYCLTIKAHAARNMHELGRFQEAADIQQNLVEVLSRIGNDIGTLTSTIGLASNYTAMGQHQKAIDVCNDAITRFKGVFGENHPLILASWEVIGMANLALSKPKEALPHSQKVLQGRKKVYGDQHLFTLIAMQNLASVYEALRLFKEAWNLQEQCAELAKISLGVEHRVTVNALGNLADYARKMRRKKGMSYRKETLEILQTVWGEADPRTLRCLEMLGEDYFAVGALKKARLVQEELVGKMTQGFGKDDQNTIRAVNALSRTRKTIALRKAVYWWAPRRYLDRNM